MCIRKSETRFNPKLESKQSLSFHKLKNSESIQIHSGMDCADTME